MSADEGLAIVLLTYNRLAYAKRTLKAIFARATYTRGPIHLHIASDGDSEEYVNELIEAPARLSWHGPVTTSNSGRRGYGANYNAATQMVHQLPGVKYVLPLEDDWEAIRPLDLDHFTRLLDGPPLVGCVRMGYLGFTQELSGVVIEKDHSLLLGINAASAEPHVWAGHPRLETVEWQKFVGPWQEGLGAGATEFEVAHRENARKGVVWPMEIDPRTGYGVFAHIGSTKADEAVSG